MDKRKTNTKNTKAPMNKRNRIIIYVLAGIIFLLTVFLIAIENVPNCIVIKNNTNKKLEYVKAYFVDAEGQFTDTYQAEDLTGGSSEEIDLEKMDFSYREANLEIRFKFEGYDELFVDAGYFNEIFDGKITISFTEEDGNILLHVKAAGGILPNPNLSCDEEYTVNLEEGYVDD